MTATTVERRTIRTAIPARLDRLPWSRFHWLVVLGLGTVWILDGLEVTIVGSIASQLTQKGSGISISTSQIGTAGAVYVIGACLGALFFGQLTDRFGRKKLFMITLAVYIVATAATAFSFAPWFFFLCRFFTGAGIGGEYAAINSAIDELIPARMRGRVDLAINGSFWVGSIIASAVSIFFLSSVFPTNVGWRLEFAVGVILAFGILLVRRHVPESPRWLFIHGHEEEAEQIVDGIEHSVEKEVGHKLETPDKTITVREREAISFREIGRVAFKAYPSRAVLGLCLFVGQAFIYNGITFNLGTLFTTFFGVAAASVPVFIILYAVGNFLGPFTLGRLFDTIGRKPMIAGTYLGSALLTVPMAILFANGSIGKWPFMAFVFFVFFLASAGASAAYLTVSEIFPMETRAMAIAFFYAFGTALGGISGPAIFGGLIASGKPSALFVGFALGAVLMIGAGLVELWLGVEAAGRELEDIAAPLSAREAEREASDMFTLGRDRRVVRATRAQEALAGRRVADVMVRDPVTVNDDLQLDRFIEDVFLTHRHTAYPVVGTRGDVIGLLTVRDVLELPREQWAALAVRDRMLPVERSLVVDAEEPLDEALRDLARTEVHRALVSDHGHLHSLLSMTDVARTFEVLAGEDIGYIGGTPHGRFSPAERETAGAPAGDGGES